jgi:polyhydroxyalkanoate synthase
VKLYHYDRSTPAKCKTPVLVSFALINRHDVLDLQPDRSLMKKLLDEGLDIYIMDWGYPQKQHRYLTMEDYIDGFMNDAVDHIRKTHKVDKIHQMGICQGGTFSAIYASLYPEKIKSLTTYVAPYDFDNQKCMLYTWTKYIDVDSMVDSLGVIPADTLNGAFGMLKPSMDVSKYFGVVDSLTTRASCSTSCAWRNGKTIVLTLPAKCSANTSRIFSATTSSSKVNSNWATQG